jgi:hypothetical protein
MLRSVIMKLKSLVSAGTPPSSNAGDIVAHAGMLAQENRKDRGGLSSSDAEFEKLK